MSSDAGVMEEFYEIFPWPEDEESLIARTEEAKQVFRERVLRHPWLQGLLGKRRLRVLDVCGGAGVGGIGFALAAREHGVEVDVAVNDVRASALSKALALGRKLGVRVETVQADALELDERLGRVFDIAILYGYSTPHFDPYELARLAVVVAHLLVDDGVFLVEETDRVYSVLARGQYRQVHVEHAETGRVVASFEAGYDPRRGVFERVYMELPGGRSVKTKVRLHDVAGTAAILWLVFQDVDFVATRTRYSGMLVAHWPRRTLAPEDLGRAPSIASGAAPGEE